MANKVKLENSNFNEGILGQDDPIIITPNRGFSDRSIGDEFYRIGRNPNSNVIENPEIVNQDLSAEELEDLGYDYDGSEEAGEDEAYPMHPDLRNQLMDMRSRIETMEGMVFKLFGSRGTTQRPLIDTEDDQEFDSEME